MPRRQSDGIYKKGKYIKGWNEAGVILQYRILFIHLETLTSIGELTGVDVSATRVAKFVVIPHNIKIRCLERNALPEVKV